MTSFMLDKSSVTKDLFVRTVESDVQICSSAFVVWQLAGLDGTNCIIGRIIAEWRDTRSLGALRTCKICLLLDRKGESWYDVAAELPEEPLESPG